VKDLTDSHSSSVPWCPRLHKYWGVLGTGPLSLIDCGQALCETILCSVHGLLLVYLDWKAPLHWPSRVASVLLTPTPHDLRVGSNCGIVWLNHLITEAQLDRVVTCRIRICKTLQPEFSQIVWKLLCAADDLALPTPVTPVSSALNDGSEFEHL